MTTATAAPSPGEIDRPVGIVLSGRPVPAGTSVAVEFAADRAGGPHQGSGDLPQRLAGCMQPANRFALRIAELTVLSSHRNAILTKALRLMRELGESSGRAVTVIWPSVVQAEPPHGFRLPPE
jgi:hypothetical protein